ncbi:MAG: beta-ketoacyl synthase chain length factor [Flavobacteriales bacterium]|nr:beta-ketoacyl synthase chain length factor [Flavobacteriales bacterium]
MRAYIQAYKTISHRNSFENGILASLKEETQEDIVHPDYKSIIPPALIRRMSSIIRMGVGMALAVKEEQEIEGIIVGTGLGCLANTEKFMEQFVKKTEGILAPTAFIQSTHNTIAGQIGLILKDNCYNSTYTQRGISFENALLDAIMISMETEGNVLVGGVDEVIPLMDDLGEKAEVDTEPVVAGGSFFRLSGKKENAVAEIAYVTNLPMMSDDLEKEVDTFLKKSGLPKVDLILFGHSFIGSQLKLRGNSETEVIDYSAHSGIYMTNSAYGLQMAAEYLAGDTDYKTILVVNNFDDKVLGMTYVQKA